MKQELDPLRCSESVYYGTWGRSHQCNRKWSVEREVVVSGGFELILDDADKHEPKYLPQVKELHRYCKQHDPELVKAKEDARQKAWHDDYMGRIRKIDEISENRRLAKLVPVLLKALKSADDMLDACEIDKENRVDIRAAISLAEGV